MLRLEWWLNHGHTGLYGDDGEMQCPICPADFKRQPLGELEALVSFARNVAMPVFEVAGNGSSMSVTFHDRGGPLPTLPEGHHPVTSAVIQRARGYFADGADFAAVAAYASAYVVHVPLPEQDVRTLFRYLLEAASSAFAVPRNGHRAGQNGVRVAVSGDLLARGGADGDALYCYDTRAVVSGSLESKDVK